MALPASGTISLNDAQTEFGGTNPISISEYYGMGSLPGSGVISLSDFHGQSAMETRTISGNVADLNMAAYLASEGVTSGDAEVTITGNVYSTSTGNAGLDISSIPAGINLTVILASSARLYGKGGAGASYSGGSWSGFVGDVNHQARYVRRDGAAGGTALYVRSNCAIIDQGAYIYGGGGGGATIRLHQEGTSGTDEVKGCGGGGGGRGYSGGAGGAREPITSQLSSVIINDSVNGTAGTSSAAGTGGRHGWAEISGKGITRYGYLPNGVTTSTTNQTVDDNKKAGNGGGYGAAGGASGTYDSGWSISGDVTWVSNLNAYGAGGAGGKSIDGTSYITWTGYNDTRYSGSVV